MMDDHRSEGQVGYPPRVATDPSGSSVTAYRSASILFASREGDSHILGRIEGARTRAHQGGRTELSQRATVG